jgi:hypothetical protein
MNGRANSFIAVIDPIIKTGIISDFLRVFGMVLDIASNDSRHKQKSGAILARMTKSLEGPNSGSNGIDAKRKQVMTKRRFLLQMVRSGLQECQIQAIKNNDIRL